MDQVKVGVHGVKTFGGVVVLTGEREEDRLQVAQALAAMANQILAGEGDEALFGQEPT